VVLNPGTPGSLLDDLFGIGRLRANHRASTWLWRAAFHSAALEKGTRIAHKRSGAAFTVCHRDRWRRVSLENWRMWFAPPAVKDRDRVVGIPHYDPGATVSQIAPDAQMRWRVRV